MNSYEKASQDVKDAFNALCKSRVEAAVLAEREACAKVCEEHSKAYGGVAEGTFVTDFGKHTHMSMAAGAENCAAAIRERSASYSTAIEQAEKQSAEHGEPVACGHCNGSGRMVRDPDIGTDQECFVCDGSGVTNTPPAAPVQEPVAWVDWLPEGTTHIAKCKATTSSGGSLSLRTHAFKYEADVLKVYTTDNDNEYPGWRAAKDVFYHLNFAIVPIYTTPLYVAEPLAAPVQEQFGPQEILQMIVDHAAQRQWVSLPDAEIDLLTNHFYHNGRPVSREYRVGIARAIEAKLRELNGGQA